MAGAERFRLLRALRRRDRYGIAAALLYLALALGYFVPWPRFDLTARQIGRGADPSFLIWALAWWPYALAHRLNPLVCRLVWAPAGFNLAWSAAIPFASLVTAPLTAVRGPLVTYNVLVLAAPTLAAWSGFLLCRQLTARSWVSWIAGYSFGFSSYVSGQILDGHLNLLLVFPVPLIVLVFLRAWQGKLGRARFVGAAALLLVILFLCSIELAASAVIFGGAALIVGWCYAGPNRSRLLAMVPPLACAGLIAAIILSPYLYYLLAPGVPHGTINSPGWYSADLLNYLVPTPAVLLGTWTPLRALTARFPGNTGEAGAYLPLPLLLMLFWYARRHADEPLCRVILVLLAIIVVASLGPRLHVAGWTGFGLPWKLFMHVPFIKNALPVRFTLYVSLGVAIIAAYWLAAPGPPLWVKWSLALLIIPLGMPNLARDYFTEPVRTPAFFTDGGVYALIPPHTTALILPFSSAMRWQAASGMSFRLAGGYTGLTPHEYLTWPIIGAFMTATALPDAADQLKAFMAAHDASVALVDDAHHERWGPLLATLDAAPRAVDGVWLYHAGDLSAYRGLSAASMEQRSDVARFDALLAAAAKYLAQGGDPASLTPLTVAKMGLLPRDWVRDGGARTHNGLFLGPLKDRAIGVGVVGSYDALRPMIERYRTDAARVYFPYPNELKGAPGGNTFMRLLVIVFDRQGLARAAASADRR